jgi:hypothetical protein
MLFDVNEGNSTTVTVMIPNRPAKTNERCVALRFLAR